MIDKNDPRLTAFLLDELNGQEAAEVQAAIDESPELREQVEALRGTIGMLHRACADPTADEELTPDQLSNIDAAVTDNIATIANTDDGLSARIRWRNLAIAALLLYAVGISVVALRKPAAVTSLPAAGAVASAPSAAATTNKSAAVNPETINETVAFDDSSLRPAERAANTRQLAEPQSFDAADFANPFGAVEMDNKELEAGGMMGGGDVDEFSIEMESQPLQRSGSARGGRGFAEDTTIGFDGLGGMPTSDLELTLENNSFGVPGPAGDSGVFGDPQPEGIAESGQIVIRGKQQDVDRVLEIVNEIEADRPEPGAADLPATAEPEAATSGKDANGDEAILPERDQRLKQQPAKQPAKTWKPATASTNRARLSVGHHDDLALAARDTYVRIDGFRARVLFDLYYYNDRPQQLEGRFMLRLPNDASLHYLAFGPTAVPTPDAPPATGKPGEPAQQLTAASLAVQALRQQTAASGSDLARRAGDSNYAAEPNSLFGLVKAARIAPRQKAALAYEETVRRRVDPALVEWAGPGIFQTRVFPLLPNQLHRIVIGYDVMLTDDGDDRLFSLNLPEGEAGGRVEFDVAAAAGTEAMITPDSEAFVSGGRAYYRFVDAPPRDYTVRLSGTESVVLKTAGANDAYFATRIIANLPAGAAETDTDRAVLLLDTSWSDRPAAFSRRLKLLEQVLQQNRDSIKQFAVLMFNVEQRWWRSEFVANTPKHVADFRRDANQLVLEGATDLYGALAAATDPTWMEERERAQPQPNYFLFSDASPTWGKTDLASLADPLTQLDRSAGGGALFAYHLAGHASDKATQQWLAEASGGAVFDVAEAAELELVAAAHRSRPWQIVKATARGADEILVQGSSHTVYPNQPLVIAGRGELKGPLKIVLARGKKKRTIEFQPQLAIASPAAARLYGQLAVERLEPYADDLQEVTVAFARYFRVPGRTCSLVMLEGPEDYERFGVNVPPAEDQLVIASTLVASVIEEQESEMRRQRTNSRLRFTAWVDSLQSASLLNVSTALKLAMKRLPDTAFQFEAKPLVCQVWQTNQLGNAFGEELKLDAPGFDAVVREAERRRTKFGVDDALKVASTLVEAKPADADTLRSVAFRALDWQRSDQAAPLLWRLAQARPYQPQCLLLLARATAESGDLDSAIVCYDLVSSGNWNDRWSAGAKDIAQIELLHLLEKVDSGEVTSVFPQYARARLRGLRNKWCDEGLDFAVVMHWNTDRTDVDLHVTEPSGEECFYSHNQTKSGGRLSQDITQGLGPEMYTLENAPQGSYRVAAKYFSADQNRTRAPTETLLTVLRNVGRPQATAQTKRITLNGTGEKQLVLSTKVTH